jgi:hypothetical protein
VTDPHGDASRPHAAGSWTTWLRCVRDDAVGVGPEAKHLLMVIASYADAEGRCYPSLDTLASGMGLADGRSARRRVRLAIESGWLAQEHAGRWKGDPSRYRLTPVGCIHAKGVQDDTLSAGSKGGTGRRRRGYRSARKGGTGRPPNVQERSMNTAGAAAGDADRPAFDPAEEMKKARGAIDWSRIPSRVER